MIVETNLRVRPVAAARNVSYEPGGTITATNVQDAIRQVAAAARALTETAITAAMSPYTPVLADDVLLVDTTAGPVTIQLPLSATRSSGGRYIPLTVKDDKENADVNAISVIRSGAELIDGLTTYPLDSKSIVVKFQPISGGYDVI